MQYLSYRKRTRKEIKLHLLKQDFPEAVIARAIDYCEHLQLIDHRDYMISLKIHYFVRRIKGLKSFDRSY